MSPSMPSVNVANSVRLEGSAQQAVDHIATSMADAVLRAVATDREILMVYVRKGLADHERWLSFRIGDRLDATDLLERGMAIDGNQAVCAVRRQADAEAFVYPTLESGANSMRVAATLPEALYLAEMALVQYLRPKGITPRFS